MAEESADTTHTRVPGDGDNPDTNVKTIPPPPWLDRSHIAEESNFGIDTSVPGGEDNPGIEVRNLPPGTGVDLSNLGRVASRPRAANIGQQRPPLVPAGQMRSQVFSSSETVPGVGRERTTTSNAPGNADIPTAPRATQASGNNRGGTGNRRGGGRGRGGAGGSGAPATQGRTSGRGQSSNPKNPATAPQQSTRPSQKSSKQQSSPDTVQYFEEFEEEQLKEMTELERELSVNIQLLEVLEKQLETKPPIPADQVPKVREEITKVESIIRDLQRLEELRQRKYNLVMVMGHRLDSKATRELEGEIGQIEETQRQIYERLPLDTGLSVPKRGTPKGVTLPQVNPDLPSEDQKEREDLRKKVRGDVVSEPVWDPQEANKTRMAVMLRYSNVPDRLNNFPQFLPIWRGPGDPPTGNRALFTTNIDETAEQNYTRYGDYLRKTGYLDKDNPWARWLTPLTTQPPPKTSKDKGPPTSQAPQGQVKREQREPEKLGDKVVEALQEITREEFERRIDEAEERELYRQRQREATETRPNPFNFSREPPEIKPNLSKASQKSPQKTPQKTLRETLEEEELARRIREADERRQREAAARQQQPTTTPQANLQERRARQLREAEERDVERQGRREEAERLRLEAATAAASTGYIATILSFITFMLAYLNPPRQERDRSLSRTRPEHEETPPVSPEWLHPPVEPLPPRTSICIQVTIFRWNKPWERRDCIVFTAFDKVPLTWTVGQFKRFFAAPYGNFHPLSWKIRAQGRWLRHGRRTLQEEGIRDWEQIMVINATSRDDWQDHWKEGIEEGDGMIGAREGWPFRGLVRAPADRNDWVNGTLSQTRFPLLNEPVAQAL